MNSTVAIGRLREVLRRQHKALSTEECYVFWLRRYMAALPTMPVGISSEAKLERFLTELASRHNVAASTQNQAFNAILFFYREVLAQPLGCVSALRAKRPVHERHAPTVAETHALVRAIQEAMGHKSLETTMGCLHAESLSVHSPLEALNGAGLRTAFMPSEWPPALARNTPSAVRVNRPQPSQNPLLE
jgi:hypothetical protein